MSEDLFGPSKARDIRLSDKIAELTREIKVRKRVYPRWVQAGRLDGPLADHRILVLEAVLKDLKTMARSVRAPTEGDPSGNAKEAEKEGQGQRADERPGG